MKVELFDLNNQDLANCWILTDEKTGKAAIADIGWFYDELKNYIDENKLQVEYILLTHGHFDHIMGAKAARDYTGAKILIHSADEPGLREGKINLMDFFRVQAPLAPCEADVAVEDGDTVKIGESELKIMHTPGHSAGSIIFIDEEGRNIISGDTIFRSTVGRTDCYGGSSEDMKASLKKILALEGDYDIYPGHGPKTELSHERVRNIFIRRMNRAEE